MSTFTPSPSSHLRSADLDNVRDVILLEGDDIGKGEPIPRTEGPRALRGTIEGRLGACIVDEDLAGERRHSLELAQLQFDRGLDLDRAVQLLHRALEIEDDHDLREELVRQLSMMGRHVEGGHVLRDGEAHNHDDVVVAWLQSGDAYARAGDAGEAIATYREVAMLAPDDARPFERIACLANWDPDAVPPERAADALLEAAKRYPAGHDRQIINLCHAFDLAPAYARSAEGLTKLLESQGRHREADEVWREYGAIAQHAQEVAKSRVAWARQRGDAITALAAALDACIIGKPDQDGRDTTLNEVLAEEDCGAALRAQAIQEGPFESAMVAAARTKSGMGRAEAFTKLSRRFGGELRALLLTFASEAYAAAGNGARAARTAAEARAVDSRLPRAHAALVALDPCDELGPGEIEAAAAHLPCRSWLVRTMAARLQAEGQHSLALIWARRLIDLRPGGTEPVIELLDRATASEDVGLISAALVAVLETVQPWDEVSGALSRALRALINRDAELAQQLGHSVLEVVGPGSELLYETYRELAKVAEDPEFAIAVTLRRAASDQVSDDERATLYLDAAELCLAHGDTEAAAEHLYCAAAHGGALDHLTRLLAAVASELDQVEPEPPSDAVLAHAHATAWTAEQQGPARAAKAWRTLGALRWDLAGDLDGADDAFFVACAHDPDGGPYRYAYDLVDRLGAEQAVTTIAERAVMVGDEGEDLALCGKLYAAAARVAAEAQLDELAVNAAVAAVQADPSRGDAVAIVEKVASGEAGLIALDFVYNTLADAALGQYGFRAAHYRAARQLERREAYDQALRHAILAFEAVPSVGASYQMLVRVAAAAGDEGAAVRTLAEVASTLPAEVETVWLLRAAELAKQSATAKELRFDLLLKAFMLRQNVALAEELGEAAAALTAEAEDGEAVHIRLERAITKALPELSGHRGAATAIALGVVALAVMAAPSLAVGALVRAMDLDRRDADFSPVLPHLEVLCADEVAAHTLLEEINDRRADQSLPLSKELREITSRLYLALSEVPPPSLAPADDSGVPPASLPPEGEETEPFTAPEARPSDAPMVEAIHEEVELDDNMMEAALASAVHDGTPPPVDGEQEGSAAGNEADGEPEPRDAAVAAAIEVLAEEYALEEVEYVEEDDELDDAIEAAEHDAERAEVAEDERRASNRPAESLDEGDASFAGLEETPRPVAEPPVTTVTGVDMPLAIDYSPASERLARERGDHQAIAAMLAARAGATDNVEQRRLIRLRRAAVLEQRLDRHEEACAELERILDETGEDATALRYLADLYGRTGRPTRAARMWLRASKQATNLDEKLRDVIRCCESLVVANRPETARRLLDAARSLPQSPRLLRLRVAVARQLDDPELLARAQAELDALGPADDLRSSPPSESLRALDSSPPSMPPPAPSSSEPPPPEPTSSEELELETEDSEPPPRPGSSEPPPAAVTAPFPAASQPSPPEQEPPDSDPAPSPIPVGTEYEGEPPDKERRASAPSAARFVADVLENCRVAYVERGTGTARDARHLVRRLRSVRDGLSEADADLHTFLLVEALDAVKGPAAAMGTLQQHWEHRGGTPLATVAVAERLVRRGDLRPALLLYDRVKGKDLRGVRSEGQVALDAAEVAREVGDDSMAEAFLERAALHPDARPQAERLFAKWFGGAPSTAPPGEGSLRVGTSSIPPAPISGEWSGEPPPSDDAPVAAADGNAPAPPESIDDLDLDETGSVTSEPTPSPAPLRLPSARPAAFASVLSRPPAFPEFIAPEEEELFDELINGSFEAGDRLVAAYHRDGRQRTHDALAVRRYQAALHRGDRQALAHLADAAIADNAIAFARAVEHVLGAFDPSYDRVDPPPLEQLAPQPEATAKLLFAPHDGTINEALGIICESGMLRRNLQDYGFTGADRVPPVATTPLGRVYAALSRLLDLGGVRLFHRSRATGQLSSAVALTTPLAAVLSGVADRETRELQYVLGSALVAATPQLALIASLDEPKARNLVRALLAGFGPVEDRSIGEASMEQMRMAEDLWHMVPSAAERRLHQICENRREMTYEAAVANAQATRRRAGLFASGDLVTAMTATIRELDLPVPRPLRGEGVLRELCNDPDLASLYDFAILPEYAEARWGGGV